MLPDLLRRLERDRYLRLAVLYEDRQGLIAAAREVGLSEKAAEKIDAVGEAIHLRRTARELLVLLLAREGLTDHEICGVFEHRVGRPIARRTVGTIRRSGHINAHWLRKFADVARLAEAAATLGITAGETARFLHGDPAWRTNAPVVDDLHEAVRNATLRALSSPERGTGKQVPALDAYLGVGQHRKARWEGEPPERPPLLFQHASNRELTALAAEVATAA
jgi:hypothetical protein